jgi:uncharacterized surface protein with fasciclin (FAS1) repeats
MKTITRLFLLTMLISIISCNGSTTSVDEQTSANQTTPVAGGQENVKDDDSQKDIVKTAISSKDHTTLVAALKQAELVTSLSNAGPFTVFAPTNAAFDKMPAGTVESLMKDEKKEDLQNILQYHVTLSAMKAESLQDGQTLGMVNGDKVSVNVKDGKVILNNNVHIIASVPASNGIVHVVDGVLLPPKQ